LIVIQLTNGFGNNLFQYNAAKLLAEFLGQEVYCVPPFQDYYAISSLKSLGFKFLENNHTVSGVVVPENSYNLCFDKKYENETFILSGYFEDYRYFDKDINKIKSWYPKAEKRKDKDLVIHFRAGDRLFYKNEFYTKPQVQNYKRAIEKFNFDKLHIVTDMPKWDFITKSDLKSMSFHYNVPEKDRVSAQESVDYFNSFIDGFSEYNPIMEKRSIVDDFNFIRTFDNILFQHGTLGWWASALSEASKVGVYGPWRTWKADSNKNLSQVGLEGWFKWE
tara:strand:- start:6276 stop:7106 length:831 start_codon:yes stop_codon:yes gene_type:complete